MVEANLLFVFTAGQGPVYKLVPRRGFPMAFYFSGALFLDHRRRDFFFGFQIVAEGALVPSLYRPIIRPGWGHPRVSPPWGHFAFKIPSGVSGKKQIRLIEAREFLKGALWKKQMARPIS